jgi:flagellar biosynthesis protein FlhF
VLDQVKAELGRDAVILGTKNVKKDGKCFCEVTAALDNTPAPPQTPAAGSSAPPRDDIAPGWGEWHREWDQIKLQLMALMRAGLDPGELSPSQRQAFRHLEEEGVAEGVLSVIWRDLKEDPTASILVPLGGIVQTAPMGDKHWSEKFHAFTGPSGVGKTTTVLRTALAYAKHHPGAKVLVVNADPVGGKGRHFLKHYSELSRLGYFEPTAEVAMSELLTKGAKFDKVFIDLPGDFGDKNLADKLKDFGLAEIKDMVVHLVLSPHYAPGQYDTFYRRYKSERTRGLVWTKLDEACNFGALVNAAYATGLPVVSLSYGSGLKNTLAPADAVSVWKLLFKHELPERARWESIT